MAIRDQLDKLCRQFPACNVVAYADLTTGMVLCSSVRLKLPQEQLDELCRSAADLLTGQLALLFARHLAPVDGTCVQTAVLIDQHSVELFLRTPAQPTEALCCHCSSQIDLADFAQAAHVALVAISVEP